MDELMQIRYFNFQEGTNRVIFAYGKEDPADEDSIKYHGTTRGTKSLSLLTNISEPSSLTESVKHYDFFNQNVSFLSLNYCQHRHLQNVIKSIWSLSTHAHT